MQDLWAAVLLCKHVCILLCHNRAGALGTNMLQDRPVLGHQRQQGQPRMHQTMSLQRFKSVRIMLCAAGPGSRFDWCIEFVAVSLLLLCQHCASTAQAGQNMWLWTGAGVCSRHSLVWRNANWIGCVGRRWKAGNSVMAAHLALN